MFFYETMREKKTHWFVYSTVWIPFRRLSMENNKLLKRMKALSNLII